MPAKETETNEDNNTCTAKLIRGLTYTYAGKRFAKGVEVPVDAELARDLENHVIERKDFDGERMQKPRFKITGLDEEEEDEGMPTRKRSKPSRRSRRS